MRFDVTKYGLSIASFELSELAGRDSMDALARCAPPGLALSPTKLNLRHLTTLVAMAITSVDDQPVERPFAAWEDWGLREQDFIIGAFNRLNGATATEIAALLKANKGPRFDLSGVSRVGIQSFELAVLTGKDRIVAVDAVTPGVSGPASSAQQTDALIAYALVKIDDKPIERPYIGWADMSMRLQEFILAAYNRINGAGGTEMDDFFDRSFGSPAEAKPSTSSASGPTSPGT